MSDFTKRIRWCVKEGRLTTADLHHWFDRPYATVRTWRIDGRIPHGPYGEDADEALAVLERLIKTGKKFPVPPLSQTARVAYIRALRGNVRTPVPKMGAA